MDNQNQVAFERLHALARRGYAPKLGKLHWLQDDGFVEMVHPRKYTKKDPAPTLTLCSNGRVMPRGSPETIGPEDAEEFARFLQIAGGCRGLGSNQRPRVRVMPVIVQRALVPVREASVPHGWVGAAVRGEIDSNMAGVKQTTARPTGWIRK